jgi:hypothetical protein
MRIQDTFHPDGLSYESGDELSETESDLRSSHEKLNSNGSFSPPSKDPFGKNKYRKSYLNNYFLLKPIVLHLKNILLVSHLHISIQMYVCFLCN